jgi:hypothetical protein
LEEFHLYQAKGVNGVLSSNLLRLFARFALFFEPISPRFVSFWLRRRLKKWKSRGLIDAYRVNTRRVGKFHYRIILDLELNRRQAERIKDELMRIIFGRFGR